MLSDITPIVSLENHLIIEWLSKGEMLLGANYWLKKGLKQVFKLEFLVLNDYSYRCNFSFQEVYLNNIFHPGSMVINAFFNKYHHSENFWCTYFVIWPEFR